MDVLKFGGSSVGSADRIEEVINILKDRQKKGDSLAVVFSAMGGVTDLLIQMSDQAAKGDESYIAAFHQFRDRHTQAARQLFGGEVPTTVFQKLDKNHDTLKDLLKGIFLVREISPRTLDYVLSFGERNSCYLISETLIHRGVSAEYLDARKVITTNKTFNNARVNFEITNSKVKAYFDNSDPKAIQIITGFIATDVGGLTTTLGRGGSDYTASILAGALDAKVLEIWTDVDGVLTTDPRKVKEAFTIKKLSYLEAMEMSHFGAKVIYPPTIQPALRKEIPIYIRNTFNPNFEGTLISKDTDQDSKSPIKGISSLGKIAMINMVGSGLMGVPGISARLFTALAQAEINIILITQASSEYSITFAVSREDLKAAREAIQIAFEKEITSQQISLEESTEEQCIIAVVGENMKSVPGISGRLFESLGKNGINVSAIAQGSSELNISIVIDKKDESKALNLIHDSFFLSEARKYHLFIIGIGLIGGTLIEQIKQQKHTLLREKGVDLRVAGIANSKKMYFDANGIDLNDYRSLVTLSETSSNPELFIEEMVKLNLPNSIFIDNTANLAIPELYDQILDKNISVVTPNKIATSSSYKRYRQLKQLAKDRNIHFLYETNVGAGLPVLSTIKSLLDSGDKIRKIEGVLSGSLSYIFNNYNSGSKFVDWIKDAKEKGFTEPDPRDDLSGSDVKRKIVILSREAGFALESEEVVADPILPKSCIEAKNVEAFLRCVEEEDLQFQKQIGDAESKGEKLRFIASMEGGKAKIGLQSVGPSNPFFGLQGSDNMIVLTTERYHSNPLVIRGPGAGADVTAAGVFSDIILITQSI